MTTEKELLKSYIGKNLQLELTGRVHRYGKLTQVISDEKDTWLIDGLIIQKENKEGQVRDKYIKYCLVREIHVIEE